MKKFFVTMMILSTPFLARAEISYPVLEFDVDWSASSLQQSFSLGCGTTKYGNNPNVQLTVSGVYERDFKFGNDTYYSVRSVQQTTVNGELKSIIILEDGHPSDNDVNIEMIKSDGTTKAYLTVDAGC